MVSIAFFKLASREIPDHTYELSTEHASRLFIAMYKECLFDCTIIFKLNIK